MTALPPYPANPDFTWYPWLLPSGCRPPVRALTAFVRLSRAVAGASAEAPAARIARLRTLGRALDDPTTPLDAAAAAVISHVRQTLPTGAESTKALHALLEACERESGGWRAEGWGDLLVHCQFAVAPIGRLVLDICGEQSAAAGRAMDALSAALWVLLSLRDLSDQAFGSFPPCVPHRFLDDAMVARRGHHSVIGARGQIRAVLDRVLDGVDRLLIEAQPLPGRIKTLSLRWQMAAQLCRAGKLAAMLRQSDPFRGPVRLSRRQRGACLLLGIIGTTLARRA